MTVEGDTAADGGRLRRAVTGAGFVLGLGFGGFLDGILFHQVLQWHHLLCYTCHPEATADEVRQNVFWDGVFHLATLGMTLAGVALLWHALQGVRARLPARLLAGAMLMGWGAFNVVEGTVNHQILGIHHVRPGPDQAAWDYGFLAAGAALIAAGWFMTRGAAGTGRASAPAR